MSAIPSSLPASTQTNSLPGTLRRRLNAEIAAINETINAWGHSDEMSEHIILWKDNFHRSLRSEPDEERVLQAFIPLLQGLLQDPVTFAPLDRECLLGSDNNTYGQNSLNFYQRAAPSTFRARSPLHPEDPTPLSVQPHLLARHMVQWLESHDALLHSPIFDQAFLHLEPQGPEEPTIPASLPSDFSAELAALEQRMNALEEQLQTNLGSLPNLPPAAPNASATALRERLRQIDQENMRAFANLREHVQGMATPLQEFQQTVNTASAQAQQTFTRLSNQFQNLLEQLAESVHQFATQAFQDIDHLAEQDRQNAERVEHEITHIQEQTQQLNADNQTLHEAQNQQREELHHVEAEVTHLNQAIVETRQAIEEMKKRKNKGLLSAIAIVGCCIFSAWALPQIIGSSSTTFSANPIRRGVNFMVTKTC